MPSFKREFNCAPHNSSRIHTEGGYGKVYIGKFSSSEGQCTFGVVKRWINVDEDPQFQRETVLLSDNKHENLISLIGFCVSQTKAFMTFKNANILLDENWRAKIADFGFTKYGPTTQNLSYLITQAKGTLGYADPKNHQNKKFEIIKIVDANLRQQMKQESFDTSVKVALQCVERDAKRRPSMDSIVSTLESALKSGVEASITFTEFSLDPGQYRVKMKPDFTVDHLLGQKIRAKRSSSGSGGSSATSPAGNVPPGGATTKPAGIEPPVSIFETRKLSMDLEELRKVGNEYYKRGNITTSFL
ncbi:hypothetical protein LXL04_029335 [Taraxacum kok-saghyz]